MMYRLFVPIFRCEPRLINVNYNGSSGFMVGLAMLLGKVPQMQAFPSISPIASIQWPQVLRVDPSLESAGYNLPVIVHVQVVQQTL